MIPTYLERKISKLYSPYENDNQFTHANFLLTDWGEVLTTGRFVAYFYGTITRVNIIRRQITRYETLF